MSLLYTHSRELTASLNELKEPSSNTDWILFGYEGDDITLINSGTNGLEEIKDEFDEECVQYALLKIFDETSKMLRYIYIAWCGEYAPPFQKANFSQHSQIIENFFKGYHVKINARCYEDVEPENIISKVQNTSFTNFSTKVAPIPLKKPVFNLPNRPINQELKKLPTPKQFNSTAPVTFTLGAGAKKNENPTPTVTPTPTPTKNISAPTPGPRPNPLSPRPNPLAPRTNPLAPKANPLNADASKPVVPVSTKPVVSPQPTTTTQTSSPSPSLGVNPLNPKRANPLSPRMNPLAPKPNPLNRNDPLTEPVQSNQSEKAPIKSYNPFNVARVNVNTNVFDNVKIDNASEPVVENDGIDTSSRDSVANVRKMFEKKPEKKINKVMLKSQLFSNNNNEYASKAKVREERLRREQEDNALLEREKLANKQRELSEEISESRKSNETVNVSQQTSSTNPFRNNPLNSQKSNPVNVPKANPLSPPKSNPVNVPKANPLSPPKINPLNARANPLSPPKTNPLNARANPLSPPKTNPLNARANPLSPPKVNPLNSNKTEASAPPALPARENPLAPPALPARENPLAPPALPARENPLAPPALPARDTAPALPTRSNPLAPPPLPQRVLDSSPEERERKEREERERKEREEKERKEREERERIEREERERKQREEQEKQKAKAAKSSSGDSAIVTFDYEPQEENEIALVEGEIVVNIIQLDEGWWQGENSKGEVGLFPSNYVELMAATAAVPEPAPTQNESGKSAIALYDYDAQEDNEISFKEGDIITKLNFITDDWWEGVVNGKCGLFPGNYVEINN